MARALGYDGAVSGVQMSAPVTVYRTGFCPYCTLATRLLQRRGIPFTEISLDYKADDRRKLQERTQWLTVPQIFVGDQFVGGYTELAALDGNGKLSALLAKAGWPGVSPP